MMLQKRKIVNFVKGENTAQTFGCVKSKRILFLSKKKREERERERILTHNLTNRNPSTYGGKTVRIGQRQLHD